MDERVNDFLKEIEEIVPEKSDIRNDNRKRNIWKKCIDDTSGFPYYWNIKSDEVTWEKPHDYEDIVDNELKDIKTAIPEDVKIYKIGKENVKIIKIDEMCPTSPNNITTPSKVIVGHNKRLPLVSSYGSATESDEDDVEIIKNKLKQRVTSKNMENSAYNEKIKSSGFSLIAGYESESDEEDEKLANAATSHSTLFPIVEPVDIQQFSQPKNDSLEITTDLVKVDNVDKKAFQRKRRIDVPVINAVKKTKLSENTNDIEKDKNVDLMDTSKTVQYTGFKSGGVLFNKEDHSTTDEVLKSTNDQILILKENLSEETKGDLKPLKEDIEQNKNSLKEKLTFLNEGRDAATVIQTILIQMETLYEAYNSGSLTPEYLSNWLNDIASELVKLELQATPPGWLLQWDRSQKRYFYCNRESGHTQWDYPVNDVNVSEASDDAMDISMTPPPPEEEEDKPDLVPPPPPKISRTVTPPPPVISTSNNVAETANATGYSVPTSSQKMKEDLKDDSITSALNSFYSDIAAIETKTETPDVKVKNQDTATIENGKKKKTKVKLSQGLSMKKKGVSKLVEKWKNLQHSYD